MSEQILVGADPEMFCVREGKVVGAIGILPGNKHEPHRTEHGWIQPDNMLAEFNIAPAASRDEFLRSIRAVERDLCQFVQCTALYASHEFSKEELDACGPDAYKFGCEPDFNAWRGGNPNRRPDPLKVGGLRTAGGHIHIGCNTAIDRPLDVIKGMDILLGLPSVLFDHDSRRREVYGKAGAFRYKKYGVEYRTLSNFWLLSDGLVTWAYDRTIQVVRELDDLVAFGNKYHKEIVEAINASDQNMAQQLSAEYHQRVA